MDDESYVKADFKQIRGREFHTANKRGNVADKYKNKKFDKFPKKFLIWQAICQCGFKSDPFVSTGTINQEIYVKECLQKRLLPLIRLHKDPVLFWPDLAICHYGKMALGW
ncbi:PREDICTED: uncharacterized protein LOC108367860 isoform X3 [Rhagoletis zephyria]|uniref:uncharacterized protein LOC108367860 isoform X1 n=1 Tax=Rhagoletis zephyria TaxID=28612 RepID=UPI0008113E11|nr:PREDICTED: uncharacterized protein LOC108367860 isoform X1 [Rhagoletis zephyria]XP_017478045.1 PREDICTED: uncharacterized protein LOC108367860 isoform X2 [Rhagoletis zephyria]XP_017478047.1 PREDICTED: uncharacterized protein LOC108367860 isoform X3 [Rhagoletis zephyria]